MTDIAGVAVQKEDSGHCVVHPGRLLDQEHVQTRSIPKGVNYGKMNKGTELQPDRFLDQEHVQTRSIPKGVNYGDLEQN